jgi:acyl-CoA dehydrogenase
VLNPMWSDAGFVADLLRARPSRTSIRESDAGREIEPACPGLCGHSLSARIPRHRHGLRFWCWSRRTGAAALRVAGDAVTRPAAGVDRPALHRRGALARAVVMAGAMERALDTAVTYAGERKQFGRPIGKFQAVQQNLAVMAGQVGAAGAAADAGGEALSIDDPAKQEFLIAIAKTRVGDTATLASEIAHQVHGAIGFTKEYALQLSTPRLWSWRDEFGGEAEWAAKVGAYVCAGGADALRPMLTDG